MDREAWKVTVHRVTKSRTRLLWFSTVQTFLSFQVYKSTHQIMPTVEFSLKSAKYPESRFVFFFFFPWECTEFEESRTGKLLLSCTRGKRSKYQHDPPSVCYAMIKRVLCLRARSLTLTILTGNKNIYIWDYINTCYFNRYILIKYFFWMKTFSINLHFWMMVQFMRENCLSKKVKSAHKMDRFESSCYTVRRRQWHPTPVLLLRKSHGWRSLVGCSPWGR